MKADDMHVKGNRIESTEESSEVISKIYKEVVGLLKTVKPGVVGHNNENLLNNPIIDLSTMSDSDNALQPISDIDPKWLRMFDREARKHLLFLSKRINNYEGNVISLGAEVPFQLKGESKLNIDLINQVFVEVNARKLSDEGRSVDSR